MPVTSSTSSTIWKSTPSSRGVLTQGPGHRRRSVSRTTVVLPQTLAPINRPVFSSCNRRSPSAPAGSQPLTSTYCPPTIPPTPVASASSTAAASTRSGGWAAARASGRRPPHIVRRRRESRRPRRTRHGRSAGLDEARRRPSPEDRRGSASRCGSSRSPPQAAARPAAHADRLCGRERQHRPYPLAAREQRIAHRLLQARGQHLHAKSAAARDRHRRARAGAPGSRLGTAARAGFPGPAAAPCPRACQPFELGRRSVATAAHSSTSVAAASTDSSPLRSCSAAWTSRVIISSSSLVHAAPAFSRTSRKTAPARR